MNISIRNIEDVTAVSVKGKINGSAASKIQKKLLPLVEPDGKILLDMSEVKHLSSAGLRNLLLLARKMEGGNGRMALTQLRETVRDMMSATGFLDLFEEYETFDEGLRGLE